MNLKDKIAILVVSCDKYSDLWDPFFKAFWKYWPACPLSVYLLSNELRHRNVRVENITVGQDISWSDNLANALAALRQEYVFLHLDDLFLYRGINSEKVLKLFQWALLSDANYLRVNPTPGPDRPHSKEIGIITKGALYRTSTVLSLWKRRTLLDLLKPGESAWEFELHGAKRSDLVDGFFASTREVMHVFNGVIKGKWDPEAVRRLEDMGCRPDLARRQMMTRIDAVLYKVKKLRSMALRCFPSQYRRGIRELVLGTRCDYMYYQEHKTSGSDHSCPK